MLRVDDLLTAFGNYYKEGNINVQNLHTQIFQTADTAALFPTAPTNSTRIDEVNGLLTSVLQPFYAKFSHLGAMDFKPHSWDLDQVKINVEMVPDVLVRTALGFLTKRGVDVKDSPIVSLIPQYLIMQAQEDDENQVIFKGVRKDVTTTNQNSNLPGAVVDSRTGIRHKIRLFNQAGLFTSLGSMVAMGAVPTDPVLFVTYMETLYYSIPEKYRKYIKWFAMSTTLRLRFRTGMRIKYNMNYPQAPELSMIIDTDVKILGFTSHDGSDMIWTTVDGNQYGRKKNPTNALVFDVHKKDSYTIQFATDWHEGQDFINPAWIWTNGHDLAIPA